MEDSSFQTLVAQRKTNLRYVERILTGDGFWNGTVNIPRTAIKLPPHPIRKPILFFRFSMALGNVARISDLQAYIKAIDVLLGELEETTGKASKGTSGFMENSQTAFEMDYSHCMYNLCEMLEIMYQRLESSPPIIIASSLRIDAKVQKIIIGPLMNDIDSWGQSAMAKQISILNMMF